MPGRVPLRAEPAAVPPAPAAAAPVQPVPVLRGRPAGQVRHHPDGPLLRQPPVPADVRRLGGVRKGDLFSTRDVPIIVNVALANWMK